MSTLRIPVSGERRNFVGNLKILPGIGSLEKLCGKLQIISGYDRINLNLACNFVLISGDVSGLLSERVCVRVCVCERGKL